MIAAIDCDLRKHYCVDEDGNVLAKADPSWNWIARLPQGTTVLFEIASAVDYTSDKAVAHNKRRWTIWNVAQAMYLDTLAPRIHLLVAPSSAWTKGYDLKTRHFIAHCKQKQKDLREAEAMILFYRTDPKCWKPLHQYLEEI